LDCYLHRPQILSRADRNLFFCRQRCGAEQQAEWRAREEQGDSQQTAETAASKRTERAIRLATK